MNSRYKDKVMVFIWNISVIGGIETLISRMIVWLKAQNIRIIFVKHGEEIKGYFYENFFEDKSIEVYNSCDLDKIKFHFNEEVTVLTFSFSKFRIAEKIKQMNKNININVLFYTAHPTAFFYEQHYTNKYLKSFAYFLLKKITSHMNDNQNFVHMCKEFKVSFSKHYKYKPHKSDRDVVKISSDIECLDKEVIYKRYNNKVFNILTISRFYFPMYNYQIGVMGAFEKIEKKYPNVSLTIIGYGDNESQKIVNQKYNSISDRARSKINLVGQVKYSDLNSYIDSSNVYLGAGALDSRKRGLITIIMNLYNLEAIGECFSHDYPEYNYNNEYLEKDPNVKPLPVEEYIEKVINMKKEEYYENSIKTYNYCKDNFDIDKNVDSILEKQNSDCKNKKLLLLLNLLEVSKNIDVFLRKYF